MLKWSLLLSAATLIHPGTSAREFKRRATLLYRLVSARGWVSRWFGGGQHALLRQDIERDPRLLGFLVWPYVHAGWPAERRLDALSEHRRVVCHAFPWLALAEGDRREILGLDAVAAGLRLELERPAWFVREGGLVVSLFLDDHRLKSLAFSLAREAHALVAYVGGFQGSNQRNALEIYRGLTKKMHGLRPRDFLLKTFQIFAGALGVERILCVADDYRHHRHPYFEGSLNPKLFLNYDEIWRENGAELLASGFYLLPPIPAQKRFEDVPSRKRAMYRRRLEMMTALGSALRAQLPRASEARDARAVERSVDAV